MGYHAAVGAESAARGAIGRRVAAAAERAHHKFVVGRGTQATKRGGVVGGNHGGALPQGEAARAVFYYPRRGVAVLCPAHLCRRGGRHHCVGGELSGRRARAGAVHRNVVNAQIARCLVGGHAQRYVASRAVEACKHHFGYLPGGARSRRAGLHAGKGADVVGVGHHAHLHYARVRAAEASVPEAHLQVVDAGLECRQHGVAVVGAGGVGVERVGARVHIRRVGVGVGRGGVVGAFVPAAVNAAVLARRGGVFKAVGVGQRGYGVAVGAERLHGRPVRRVPAVAQGAHVEVVDGVRRKAVEGYAVVVHHHRGALALGEAAGTVFNYIGAHAVSVPPHGGVVGVNPYGAAVGGACAVRDARNAYVVDVWVAVCRHDGNVASQSAIRGEGHREGLPRAHRRYLQVVAHRGEGAEVFGVVHNAHAQLVAVAGVVFVGPEGQLQLVGGGVEHRQHYGGVAACRVGVVRVECLA